MTPDVQHEERRPTRRGLRILKSTALLPAMFTILNGVAGFASIHFAARDAVGRATLGNLTVAAWLLVAAMVCDLLDGRLARLTRRTSDFGGQLDSLCDMISFGVAPAMLMLRTVAMAFRNELIGGVGEWPLIERAVWAVAAVYVACSALRLARFNVENEPDESKHMNFKGLPSPAAAAAVVTLVLLFESLVRGRTGLLPRPWMLPYLQVAVGIVLPIVTLVAALLMVSRFRYPHLVNQYIRGRRPFGYLVKLVIVILLVVLVPYLTMAAVAMIFLLSGPVRAGWMQARRRAG